MRLRTLFAILILLGGSRVRASTVKGVVIANELGGTPVDGVQVSAVEGANPTVTKKNGTFTLEFPQKRPGETIQLVVQREGYVVVNDIQLELVLPTEAAAKPLTLLLCRKGDREEMARRFYRLKSFETIEESYRKRLKELQEAQRVNATAIEELRRERDQARSAAAKAADELAKQDPGKTSKLYREAMGFFLEGKIQEGINVLDDEELKRLLTAAREREAEAEKAIEQASQAWTLKARLLTLQFRFDEAELAYKAAIEASPESLEANFAFGVFSEELNRYNQAEVAYGKCLKLGRQLAQRNPDTYLPYVAGTLNNLGNLDRHQNRMDEARQAYEEALKAFQELAHKNPETYLPYVALTLNNLGVLDGDQNRMDEARQAYEEALKAFRELAHKNPETYLPDVALALNNLGALDHDQNRMDEARQAYEEALKTYRGLAQKNPETYLPYVALALNNLGLLDGDQNRRDEARQAYEEALKIRRELARKNPETYLPDLATTLNNLGLLDGDQDWRDEARQAFEEALKIRRELAQKNPETYLPDVAETLNGLGNLHRAQNRSEEARQAYEEALAVYQRLAQRDPERFQPEVARLSSLLRALTK